MTDERIREIAELAAAKIDKRRAGYGPQRPKHVDTIEAAIREAVAGERERVFHELTSVLTSAELARAGKAFAVLDAREKESK